MASGRSVLSAPTEVLVALTELLGSPGGSAGEIGLEEQFSRLPWENMAHHSAPQTSGESTAEEPDEESSGCDFSSFPSLSLQKKAGATEDAPDNMFHQKEEVKAHVASLLSRPILVSNDQEKRCDAEDEDEDEASEFVEERIARVPHLMQQNLVLSFSTLVQSRIRAYATFLARHGLSLAATAEPSQEVEDGVVGVEQKLETLLELGNLVALGDVKMSFQCDPGKANTSSDEEEVRVSLPIKLKACISVLIPTLQGQAEDLTMDLQTSGSVTGIFTKDAAAPLLRVVQVDLDMPQLLKSMKEAAASTVSRVVDVTNATYRVPLPVVSSTDLMAAEYALQPHCHHGDRTSKKRPHIIEDDHCPDCASQRQSDLELADLDGDLSSLSPDKCGKIVDSLFGEIDVKVLSPPGKRVRFSPTGDVDALALTLPVV